MFKRLLAPVDGSLLSRKAVSAAAALAKEHDAELILLHATAPFVYPYGFDGGGYDNTSEKLYRENTDKAAQKLLQEAAESAQQHGVEAKVLAIVGLRPEDSIIEACVVHDCDLVVIATHGRGAIGRALLGSVTSRLLPRSPVPVLVYRDASMVPVADPAG